AQIKPGKLGPKLRPHDEGHSCDAPAASPAGGADVFPAICGSYGNRRAADGIRIQQGSRNVTMAYFASAIASATGEVTLPVVDQTGLTGKFDFTIEYSPA